MPRIHQLLRASLLLLTAFLVNTPAVQHCIREGKTFMLPGIMQTGKALGMITMDDALKDLYHAGVISLEDALYRAIDQDQMRDDLKA